MSFHGCLVGRQSPVESGSPCAFVVGRSKSSPSPRTTSKGHFRLRLDAMIIMKPTKRSLSKYPTGLEIYRIAGGRGPHSALQSLRKPQIRLRRLKQPQIRRPARNQRPARYPTALVTEDSET